MIEVIIVLITTAGTVINSYISKSTNKKINKIEEIKVEFESELNKLKKELNKLKKEQDKTYLTDFLADIESGQTKTQLQIKRAYEIYEEYTELHGNSYVHDKWEELVKEGVL